MANSIVWTWFRKKHTCLYKGLTVDSACQSRNYSMKSKKLSLDLQDRIVIRHIHIGKGIHLEYWKFPRAQWPPSLGNWKKYETIQPLPRADRATKLRHRARRTLVRKVTKNPKPTDIATEFLSGDGRICQKDNSLDSTSSIWALLETDGPEKKAHYSTTEVCEKAHEKQKIRQNILWSDETNI